MAKKRKRQKRETAYRPTNKGLLGMELLKTLNEWKNAGGSDIDVLLALDDFVCEAIERRLAPGKDGNPS